MVDGALVLAAGKSTRIAPVSGGIPKPLLLVSGRAVLDWNLRWLGSQGIRELWVNLHYRPELVREALGDGAAWGMHVRYAFEPEVLGTAGAWRNLARVWGRTTLVVYGDNLVRLDLERLAAAHAGRGEALATIAVFDPAEHLHTGIAGGRVHLDADGRVEQFAEAASLPGGTRGYVNAGVYLLDWDLLARVPDGFADFGRDVFPALAADGMLRAAVIEPGGYCLGLDTPEALATAHDLIRAERIVLS